MVKRRLNPFWGDGLDSRQIHDLIISAAAAPSKLRYPCVLSQRIRWRGKIPTSLPRNARVRQSQPMVIRAILFPPLCAALNAGNGSAKSMRRMSTGILALLNLEMKVAKDDDANCRSSRVRESEISPQVRIGIADAPVSVYYGKEVLHVFIAC